ncbi:factor of DNA methylation 3-like [Argentina anserina]|uniref:factor of DNA methylation 3-like n=1 Tax=Argentina anserina TaxID=57926 RepID=UPI0021767D6E|nr:factor of DNA methylation 3-like [Potentilla anserina]
MSAYSEGNQGTDIGKLRHNARVHIEKVFLELEQSEAQKKELKKNLEQKTMQLQILNEKASLETNKANELVSWLTEERKKWESEKQKLQERLNEKEEELASSQAFNQVLIVKLNEHNAELHKARHSLITALKESAWDASIGVKIMADHDTKPFIGATQRMPSLNFSERVAAKAVEVGSLWEENLKDPSWHPFKFLMDEEGKTREVIDEEDEKLKNLKTAFGDEVYEAVINALEELSSFNPTSRNPMLELWNFKEGKKASLAEGVSHIVNHWKPRKRRSTDQCSNEQNKRSDCKT